MCPIYALFKRAGRADLVGVEAVTIRLKYKDLPDRLQLQPLKVDLPPFFQRRSDQ